MSRLLRAELILPVTIVAAAIMLGVSEFMITFEFTPPGGEPLREQLASDQHGYALLMLAAFTVISMLVAVISGARTAGIVTAVFGVAALLLFLVIDLPDAGKMGDLEDPTFGLANVRTEPQSGFWLEAVGSVILGLASVAFATLRSDQLRAPTRVFTSRRAGTTSDDDRPATRKRLAGLRRKAPPQDRRPSADK